MHLKEGITVVIVSDANDSSLADLTQNTIYCALQDSNVDCIVVEKNKSVEYHKAKTIYYDFEFNYNKCLNFGAIESRRDYICFANNDLIFMKGWSNIIKEMQKHELRSASPQCPKRHNYNPIGVTKGYKVGDLFAGWCFVWETSLFYELGGLKTDYEFYCSDNVTVEQLKENGIEHGMVKSSEVQHLVSQTHAVVNANKLWEYTIGCVDKFNKDYNQNIFGRNGK